MTDRTRGGLEQTSESDGSRPFEGVSETVTVGDLVDLDSFARDLPPGWEVVADVTPFEDDPLVEVLRVRRGPGDPELLVKPVEASSPDGPVACHERRPDGRRAGVGTVETLEAAVRAATNWAHQRTR